VNIIRRSVLSIYITKHQNVENCNSTNLQNHKQKQKNSVLRVLHGTRSGLP